MYYFSTLINNSSPKHKNIFIYFQPLFNAIIGG